MNALNTTFTHVKYNELQKIFCYNTTITIDHQNLVFKALFCIIKYHLVMLFNLN